MGLALAASELNDHLTELTARIGRTSAPGRRLAFSPRRVGGTTRIRPTEGTGSS